MTALTLAPENLFKAMKYLIYIDRTISAISDRELGIDVNGTLVPLPLNPISNRFYLLVDENADNQPFLGIFNDVSVVDGQNMLTLTLAFPGYNYNKWGTWNVIDLAVNSSSDYSIDAFVSRNLQRFGDDLHKYVRHIVLRRAMQTRVRIAGHSYGGATAQPVALIYSHLTAYHKGYKASSFTAKLVESMYNESLSRYVKNEIVAALSIGTDASPSSQFSYLVLEHMRANNLDPFNQEQLVEAVIAVDKDVLENMTIEEVFAFAAPTVFCDNICDHYNSFRSTPNEATLYDKTYNFCLSSDPIAGVLNSRTLFGMIAMLFSGFRWRYQAGQVVYMADSLFNVTHSVKQYYDYITAARDSSAEFTLADGRHCRVKVFPFINTIFALPQIYEASGLVTAIAFTIVYVVAQILIMGTIFLLARLVWIPIAMIFFPEVSSELTYA